MATRDNSNTLTSDVIEPFFAVELLFDSGSEVRIWTGYGDKTINSNTYAGVGDLLSIEPIEETSEIQATGATITLNGVNSTLLTRALSTPYHGRVAKIYLGLTSAVNDMTEIFTGFMDQMVIEEGADASIITLTIENKMVALERPLNTRYTNALQTERHTGDKGLEFVEGMANKKILWGATPE